MKNKPARYSVDKNNRLVIGLNGTKLIPDGSFSIDNKNRLVYWLNKPQSFKRKYLPSDKIVFTGKWSLNPNHDLEFEISESRDILVLKGEIISAGADKLAFEINSVKNHGLNQFRVLELTGVWGADRANQIFFEVNKGYTSDTLRFKSGWKVNQNQQIVYSYQKTSLKTKSKISHLLAIDGFWEVIAANRLRYIISRGTGSIFDFKVQLETSTLYPKDGEIRYRLGGGLKEGKRQKAKIISLYGDWKLSRKLGLMFEMEYKNKDVHSLVFGAAVNLNANNQIVFNLKDKSGKNLGISVVFAHKFFKRSGGDWFLRFCDSYKEKIIDTGLSIPF